MAYVEVVIGNRNFTTGKTIIVKVNESYTFITTYRDTAFKIACDKLGLNQEECGILDWRYFGEDVTFII
jgi:hypothetical protein